MTLLEKLQSVDKSKSNTKTNINEFIKLMLSHFRFYDSDRCELESFILKGFSNDIKLYFTERYPDEEYDDNRNEKIEYDSTYEEDYGKFAIYLKNELVGFYEEDEFHLKVMFVSEESKTMLHRYLMSVKITLKFYNFEDVLTKEQLMYEG